MARIVADDNERVLSFKTSEVIFGGGRLTVRNKEIPLTYANFCEVYEEANQKAAGAVQRGGNVVTTPDPEKPDSGEQRTGRKGRKAKAEEAPAPAEEVPVAPEDEFPPWEGDEEPTNLPACPDAERIMKQHEDNPEIPLCKSLTDAGCCTKAGGPDGCPLWDRPKAEEATPKMDVNPPRRTRKKREEV